MNKEAINLYNKIMYLSSPEARMTCEFLEKNFPELRESEDEKIRKAIECIIRVYGKTQGEWIAGYDMDTLVVFLRNAFASLEKQKEPKPAEWSEEDEKAIETICKEGNFSPTEARWLKGRFKAFLRSRPIKADNWKPSEEQMAVLLSAEGLVRANNYPEKAKILASLYEQLKKKL